jgi:DNA-directed RNA polymerase subunit RPC12/RpoP
METEVVVFIVLVVIVLICTLYYIISPNGLKAKIKRKIKQDSKIRCPQCRKKRYVTTERVMKKKGISGGKATGAILTGGLSLLATGLSREEEMTQAECSNCGSVWHF